MATSKQYMVAAYKPEKSKNGTGQSTGWEDDSAFRNPGAGDGLPYVNMGNKPTIDSVEDQSITASVASGGKRITGIKANLPFAFNARYTAMDYIYFWLMGFQSTSIPVIVFEAAANPWSGTPGTEPTQGDTYNDGTNDFDYVRKYRGKDIQGKLKWFYVFETTGTQEPDEAAGTMTDTSNIFTYTAHSTIKYQKMFELDKMGRQLRNFTTEEIALPNFVTEGYEAGDKKNLFMALAKRLENYDLGYDHAIAKDWTYNIVAKGITQIEGTFLSKTTLRSTDGTGKVDVKGGFGSADWTMQSGLSDAQNSPMNYQSIFEIGETPATMEVLNLESASVKVTAPMDESQDFGSGMYLANPVLNGKYSVEFNGTISRHAKSIWQYYRDNNSPLWAVLRQSWGHDSIELYLKNMTLQDAGPDDSPVVKEPIAGSCASVNAADDLFAATGGPLANLTQTQNMPLVLCIISSSNTNQMFQA